VEKPLAPDEKAEKIIANISQAFGKVLRGQGISLHEADALDSYASDDQLKQARLLDADSDLVAASNRAQWSAIER